MTDGPSKIERVAGPALVLPGDDIDTDRIIPARFLKGITFDGLGAHVFEDDRREAASLGEVHPFDDPARRDARVLIVGANFGCGSSREHAPRALAQWGFTAIVGNSFAEIFVNNALMIGLPCVRVSEPGLERLRRAVTPSAEVVVDLRAGTVTEGETTEPAEMAESARAALLSGDWDATSLLIDRYQEVEEHKARLPYLSGF
ncbi:MAG: 3-isopropylmalate dehydratase small subunit [Planctomycetota bacterium]